MMIHRYFEDGEKLDVAGLNQITVLIDRSETELTEIGLNQWRAGLEGPAHAHADKDQIFYILSGEGKIIVGENEYPANNGCLVYIPAGMVHQSITTSSEPLSYVLYNIFSTPDKEGHASFKDHIEKVKEVRRRQAENKKSDVAGAERKIRNERPAKYFKSIKDGKVYDFGSNLTTLLLDRTETKRCEFVVVEWPAHNRGAMVAHKEKEQTFFILSGEGTVTVGNETETVKPGDLVFVPRNVPHTTESGEQKLIYLCLNSIVTETKDESFEQMYQRIAPERIRRWESGSKEVGE